MFNSSTNQQLFEYNIYNQSSHYENYRWFPLQMEAIMCLPEIDTFIVRKDEWDTKEGIGKSMKNAWYIQWGMAKGTSWAEATPNNEKIKPVAVAIVKLH